MKNIIFLVCLLVFVSCSISSPDIRQLNHTLQTAGENQSELERVLDHYKNDSLKYQAARFLIRTMSYLNYYESNKYDKYKKSLRPIMAETGLPSDLAYEVLIKQQGDLSESDFQLKNDAKTISADYLIQNIDLAFKVWQEQPWGKHITFEAFCQDILPYRIGNEPLEEWRKPYYNYFQPILDSLLTDSSPLTACQLIYDAIIKLDWAFVQDIPGPHIGGKSLFEQRLGNCREYSDYMQYAMRAVGIPGGIDMIIQNPDDSYREHYWNYLTDSTGKEWEFELYRLRPGQNVQDSARLRAKIYRPKPFIQNESLPLLYPKEALPKSLSNPFMIDVSEKYFPDTQVSIPVDKCYSNVKLLYLCVFNNSTWIPITASPIKKGCATFKGLEANIVYCPCLYIDGNIKPIINPFRLKKNGEAYFYYPDTTQRKEAHLTRKFYIRTQFTGSDKPVVYGGQFQGANNIQFKNPAILHTITDEPTLRYKEIEIKYPQAFKYIRYQSPDSSMCCMAEIEFYSKDSVKLKGRVIGTEEHYNNLPKYDKTVVFDDNPITCFWSKYPGRPWVGLELDKPEIIQRIRYLLFNDDNDIREGDSYELFYFDVNNGFISLGRQEGNREQVLHFDNVPDNAILWLRDYTRGKEERIFAYENNKQIWW